MGRFGQELRQEREGRGVTVDQICAVTKVSSRHVAALEDDRLAELPGGVFRKGIVRSYIAAIGLDERLWIDRFDATLREYGLAESLEPDWGEFAENVRKSRRKSESATGMRWFGVAMMVLALLICSWFTWKFVLHGVMQP
jgi:cytoskeleton protein RodZ